MDRPRGDNFPGGRPATAKDAAVATYFPVSGVETPLWLPPLVAFCISFFTSMGGVSGAFLLLPFQVSVLGYAAPSVSATNHLFNVVATPGGVYRYIRERRMVWPLAWATILGTLPGVFLGAWIRIAYLPDPRHFKLFAGCVLVCIAARLGADAIRKRPGPRAAGEGAGSGPAPERVVTKAELSLRRVAFVFQGRAHGASAAGVFALCFLVGIAGGIYGIGGGAIIAPFFVAVLGMPVHAVAGAALMGTLVTSAAGVAFYQAFAALRPETAAAPDWLLGLLFGAGGLCGIYLGARCQKYFPARIIKLILTGCVLFVGAKYLLGFFR